MYTNDNKKLADAQALVKSGLKVFPCHTNENGGCSCGKSDCHSVAKHPLTINGVKDATDDPDKLAEYFTGDYEIANIAIATGEQSGVVVLDVDEMSALHNLEWQYGMLPRTPTAQTGSDGRHVYFAFDERCKALKNAVKFSGGLDVRTTGGYVIAPPSIHKSGKEYTWIVSPENCELAPLPDWLFDLLSKHDDETITVQAELTEAERAKRYLEKRPPAVSGDGGHSHTFATVCRLVELFPSLDDDDLLSALEDWNDRCEPRWTLNELRHKLADARTKTGNVDATDSGQGDDGEGRGFAASRQTSSEAATDWPLLHPDAVHGIAGDIVRTIEPHTEADPVALLLTFLDGFGNLIGNGPYFIADGARHHAKLFLCVVGQSSRARKGTSLNHVKNVLAGIDNGWRQIHGLSSGEGIVAALADESEGESDRRLWCLESEFASLLKKIKREGNVLSDILRQAWDGGTIQTLTKGSPLTATGTHVSVVGHITMAELAKCIADVDVQNGFANRFLWALVKRSKLLPDGGDVPKMEELRSRLGSITQQARQVERMERSPEASRLWREVYRELSEEKPDPLWDAVTSRAPARVLRLSMLYALLDGTGTIDVEHLQAALAVWRYCDASAGITFTGGDVAETLTTKVKRILNDNPNITKTAIRDRIGQRVETDELTGTLAELEREGVVVSEEVVENRKRSTRYRLAGKSVRQVGRTLGQADDLADDLTNGSLSRSSDTAPTYLPNERDGTGANGLTDDLTDGPLSRSSSTYLPNGRTGTATLADLHDWRNIHSADYVRQEDGSIWVTTEDDLTPALKAAIENNQEALTVFVPDVLDDVTLSVDGQAFYDELKAETP